MKKVDGDIQAETHQVMKNLEAILKNAGCDFSNGNWKRGVLNLIVLWDDMAYIIPKTNYDLDFSDQNNCSRKKHGRVRSR